MGYVSINFKSYIGGREMSDRKFLLVALLLAGCSGAVQPLASARLLRIDRQAVKTVRTEADVQTMRNDEDQRLRRGWPRTGVVICRPNRRSGRGQRAGRGLSRVSSSLSKLGEDPAISPLAPLASDSEIRC